MAKFLDSNGVLYLWQKIKTVFLRKADLKAGDNVTVTTGTDGTVTVAATDTNTTYTISKSGSTITLTGSDGSTTTVTDSNTTYSNASLGSGYGTCSTAAATAAKVVTLSSYVLSTGGIVSVKFTYAVPAAATMNINSKGAKAIYYKGAAITANIIKAGDTATFIYDGTQYQLIGIDRDDNTTYSVATSSANGLMSSTDKAKLDGFGAASTYALKSDITNMYRYKGNAATKADLPTTGLTVGDVYNVKADGMNWAWTGSEWDNLGAIFSIDAITNAEIDTIVAS